MLAKIDDFLNKTTMYKLALYCLFFLWLAGLAFSFFGLVPFGPVDLIISSSILIGATFFINKFFEKIFQAPSNTESTYITGFILSLIVGPETSLTGFLFLLLVSFLAVASKYILAINKKHIFNPAAFSIAFCAFIFNYYASWWIGNIFMVPLVVIAGFLLVRKLKKTDLVISFFVVFMLVSLSSDISLQKIGFFLKEFFTYSPILFFSLIMLTEPATTPPKKSWRVAYGGLVAFLLAPFVHIGSFYFSPESALIIGNIFSYIISPKGKRILTLKRKTEIAHNTFEFVFTPDKKLTFKPGQYLEWTLGHKKQDNRGMRRYFTIASSPTEDDIKIGVKFYDKASSYKTALESLKPSDVIVASQLAGEFTLPEDKNEKLIFLAGGIGITPFRSMIKYLIDVNEKRDMVLLYASADGFAYQNVFQQAKEKLGIKTAYVEGFITQELITHHAPDYQERTYYISGPKAMITSFEKTLKEMGIPKNRIKTDFFPGYT